MDRLDRQLQWCIDRENGRLKPILIFPPKAKEQPCEPRKRFVAYVYMIRAGDYIKIGVAGNVEHRIAVMQTGCPYKLGRDILSR